MSKADAATDNDTKTPKLHQFVGQVFLWLTFCFLVWIPLSSLLAAPAVWITNLILTHSIPEFVKEFSLNGPQALLVTHFGELDGEIVSARLAGYHLAFPLNTQILTYSFPFYAALSYITPSGENLARFARGSLVLYVLLIAGLISICLTKLMAGLGPVFIDGYSLSASIIGIMSQFSTLMVPPLAPVLLWAWQSRHNAFLRQLLMKK